MRLAETGVLIALTALSLAACNKPQVAESDKPPANSETRQGLEEKTVPGMVTTNVVARTGSMSSGTANSSTVAGAAPPGTLNPANAH